MKKIVLFVLIMYGGKLFGKDIDRKVFKKEFNITYHVINCLAVGDCIKNYFNIGKITIYNNKYEFLKKEFDYNIDKNLIGKYITVEQFFEILEERITELFSKIIIKNGLINIEIEYDMRYKRTYNHNNQKNLIDAKPNGTPHKKIYDKDLQKILKRILKDGPNGLEVPSMGDTYLVNFYEEDFNENFIRFLGLFKAITPDFADKINSEGNFYIGTEKRKEILYWQLGRCKRLYYNSR